MKKLLLSSVCLLVFATSVLVIQISCSKTTAQMGNNVVNQVGKVIYGRNVSGEYQIWSANYDGTNPARININLPAGVTLSSITDAKGVKVSPDGQKLFFIASQTVNNFAIFSLYSCNTDGTNVQLVVQGVQGNGGATADIVDISAAY